MENILVIDIGNTNIVFGIYTNGNLVKTSRLSTYLDRTIDEYILFLNAICSNANISFISVSSVVPTITAKIEKVITDNVKLPYYLVTSLTELGLKYPVKETSHIGADLIVNAFCVWHKYQKNSIVCDFGTATTLQLISADGMFYGTTILPGIATSAKNLFDKASLLKSIDLEDSKVLMGLNTKDALLSGIIRGHAYSIDGFVHSITEHFHKLDEITVIATGGLSNIVIKHSKTIQIIDNTLTLEGLYRIAKKIIVT